MSSSSSSIQLDEPTGDEEGKDIPVIDVSTSSDSDPNAGKIAKSDSSEPMNVPVEPEKPKEETHHSSAEKAHISSSSSDSGAGNTMELLASQSISDPPPPPPQPKPAKPAKEPETLMPLENTSSESDGETITVPANKPEPATPKKKSETPEEHISTPKKKIETPEAREPSKGKKETPKKKTKTPETREPSKGNKETPKKKTKTPEEQEPSKGNKETPKKKSKTPERRKDSKETSKSSDDESNKSHSNDSQEEATAQSHSSDQESNVSVPESSSSSDSSDSGAGRPPLEVGNRAQELDYIVVGKRDNSEDTYVGNDAYGHRFSDTDDEPTLQHPKRFQTTVKGEVNLATSQIATRGVPQTPPPQPQKKSKTCLLM